MQNALLVISNLTLLAKCFVGLWPKPQRLWKRLN
jgi:hypothetical protein